jgi:transcriptional regulator with XRE-family HTH domain
LPIKPDYIKINPKVLEWARESMGLQPLEVSKRLNISEKTVIAWEEGNKTPSTSSLNKLASLYKRPLAALLLPSVPDEPPLPTDFRQLPNLQKHRLTKETRLSIRRARRYQRLAIELS